MSSNLNLLSDSTFGTKMDTQNGLLEDIRDSLGGGLDTSALVYGGTPDVDSVLQLKKKDPVSGNDVNVYPALAPSGVLQFLLPKPYNDASLNDDIFITYNAPNTTPSITNIYEVLGKTISNFTSPMHIWFKKSAFNITDVNQIFDKFLFIVNSTSSDAPINTETVTVTGYSDTHVCVRIAGYAMTYIIAL